MHEYKLLQVHMHIVEHGVSVLIPICCVTTQNGSKNNFQIYHLFEVSTHILHWGTTMDKSRFTYTSFVVCSGVHFKNRFVAVL